MELSIQNYNRTAHTSNNINFKNNPQKSLTDVVKNKDFLPEIILYDTGIKDTRLKSLIVEIRNRMIQQSPVPPEYTYIDKYGIIRLKPHLYIKEIIVKPEFLRQGACHDAEKRIIQLSQEEGFEGRVLLDSAPIRGTEAYIPNPSLAHWANGFRFYSSNTTKQMLDALNGKFPIELGPGGCMYYPVI